MRVLKIAAISLAGAIALLVICIALLMVFFNPNDYKPQIERLVSDNTGRQFTLTGDLELSVFPWLAVEMGPATLGNAAGFGEQPMLAIEGARLGVRVWPLLRGRFEIGEVRLDRPQVLLVKQADGANNWSDLGPQTTTEAPAEPSAEQTVEASIASLSVRDALLTYEDKQAGTVTRLKDFSLRTGKLARGAPFDLQAEFALERGADMSVAAKIGSAITADWEKGVYQLDRPTITLQVRGAGYPEKGVPVELAATRISADLQAQTATVNALALNVAGAKFDAELNATQIVDAPRVAGTLKLAPVSLRDLAPQFGIALPAMSDAQALRRVSLEAGVAGGTQSLELQPLVMKLDDTTLEGSLAIADFATTALRFDLNIDRIDIDRYLAPAEDEEKTSAKAAPAPPTPIPVDTLRKLNLAGDLKLGEATFKDMRFSDLQLSVNARDGDVRLNPMQAAFYEGRYRGSVNLDARDKTPRLAMQQELSGVNFAPLFKALYKTQRVAGRGTTHLNLTASGADTDAMKKTLDGTVDFNVADGAFEGFDLWYEIRRARALLKQESIPARIGAERTAFTSLRGSGVITDGVLNNKDLNASLQYLKVTGEGSVNLINDAVDYKLNTTVQKIPAQGGDAAAQDLSGLTIPVRITGTLDNLKVRPDVAGYVKEKAQQRLQEEKDKAEQKLKDKLQDKLRGILGG